MGWESPHWEFDNETIAACIAKLKKRNDGEVDDPVASPIPAAGSSPYAAPVATFGVSTPVSGARRSSRILGVDAEPVLKKDMCVVA
jgi:hypothetical protein